MEELLSKIFKPLLIALGGWLVIAIYNRVLFRKRCKDYLRIQEKSRSVREHYVAYLYCKGYSSTLSGRKLALKQKVAGVDETLLEELRANLKKCSWTFWKSKRIANNVVKQIEDYLGLYKVALIDLESGKDMTGVSKQLLDYHLITCHFLETLLENKDLEKENLLINRYHKHKLDMCVNKLPKLFKGYRVYIDGEYYE